MKIQKLVWEHRLLNNSKDLQAEFVGMKGFSERNLQLMRFVYEEIADNIIWQQAVAKLHWGYTVKTFKTKKRFLY